MGISLVQTTMAMGKCPMYALSVKYGIACRMQEREFLSRQMNVLTMAVIVFVLV